MTMKDKKFTSLRVWDQTHKMFRLLAGIQGLPICTYMDLLSQDLARESFVPDQARPETESIEDQD